MALVSPVRAFEGKLLEQDFFTSAYYQQSLLKTRIGVKAE
jgi:hypothetical protein